MYQIYERIKAGKVYDAERFRLIEEDFRNAGCDCVFAGMYRVVGNQGQEHLNNWFTDPMEILAKKVILFAGKRI